MKKILSVVCIALLLLQMVIPTFAIGTAEPANKNVQTKGTYENFKYVLIDGEITITGYVTAPEGELVIPEKIDGYPVTAIGELAFLSCHNLTSVFMPFVTEIGDAAFAECEGITSVNMPLVTEIGDASFYGCTALNSVNMPLVTEIGDASFYGCTALNSVEMPKVKEVGGASFAYTPWYEDLTAEFVIFGDGVLVKYNGTAAEVTVPDTVKCVAGFYGNEIVTSVSIPKATVIAASAFDYCENMKSVSMPEATVIREEAFYSCETLENVSMPKVTIISACAFESCLNLKSISMPVATSIGACAFGMCKTLENVSMPAVTSIDYHAFEKCVALKSINIPSATSIGERAFENCENLESAYFYCDAPKIFGDNVFEGCAENFTIFFAKGTNGWTTPTWNGYKTQEFPPEGWYVTFVDGLTEEVISTEMVEHGKDASLPEAPVHEGYTFTGWDKDGKNITENTTITAQYKISEYTVTFVDGLTEEVISTVTVEHGKDASLPEAPVHEGYTFTGWDKDGKNITEDTTITALYEQSYKLGDINGDGKINTADTVIVLKQAAEMVSLDEVQLKAADVNHDGSVNTADAVCILKFVAGMITEF